ncbi:MAG: hypothetical protein HC828_13765, partial [Blastochloris sp.]|nr:hypothetical protein [Blastochloris sp.]
MQNSEWAKARESMRQDVGMVFQRLRAVLHQVWAAITRAWQNTGLPARWSALRRSTPTDLPDRPQNP